MQTRAFCDNAGRSHARVHARQNLFVQNYFLARYVVNKQQPLSFLA